MVEVVAQGSQHERQFGGAGQGLQGLGGMQDKMGGLQHIAGVAQVVVGIVVVVAGNAGNEIPQALLLQLEGVQQAAGGEDVEYEVHLRRDTGHAEMTAGQPPGFNLGQAWQRGRERQGQRCDSST